MDVQTENDDPFEDFPDECFNQSPACSLDEKGARRPSPNTNLRIVTTSETENNPSPVQTAAADGPAGSEDGSRDSDLDELNDLLDDDDDPCHLDEGNSNQQSRTFANGASDPFENFRSKNLTELKEELSNAQKLVSRLTQAITERGNSGEQPLRTTAAKLDHKHAPQSASNSSSDAQEKKSQGQKKYSLTDLPFLKDTSPTPSHHRSKSMRKSQTCPKSQSQNSACRKKRTSNVSENDASLIHTGDSSDEEIYDDYGLTTAKQKPETHSFYGSGGNNRRVENKPKCKEAAEAFGQRKSAVVGGAVEPENSNYLLGKAAYAKSNSDRRKKLELAATADRETVECKWSHVRIYKPVISNEEMTERMAGRKMVRLNVLNWHSESENKDIDWVTIGVIVEKSEAKKSKKGTKYVMWKLSNFQKHQEVMTSINFFLFKNVMEALWKTPLGTVIGILNASFLERDKKTSDIALTVDHPAKVMVMGQSRDLGRCNGTMKKTKERCFNWIDKRNSDKCNFHVVQEHTKFKNSRPDLQSTALLKFTGGQQNVTKNAEYQHKGRNYQSGPLSKTFNAKLDAKNAEIRQNTKLFLEKQRPGAAAVRPEGETNDSGTFLTEMLNQPTPGTINLLKHLQKEELKEEIRKNKKSKVYDSPSNLLQMHEKMRKENDTSERETTPKNAPADKLVKSSQQQTPRLGTGFSGQSADIFFEDSDEETHNSIQKVERKTNDAAKLKALATLKNKGTKIMKSDPNSVKNKLLNNRSKELVKKRVREKTDVKNEDPEQKKSKLGDVDVNSEKFKDILDARSKYADAAEEIELEQQDRYFGVLETREKNENHMASIREMPCKVVTCKKCGYRAFGQSDPCKQKRHAVVWQKGVKRFFECTNCKQRVTSLDKYPKRPCTKCDEHKYVRTGMVREKKGPMLEREKLLVRGEERAFAGVVPTQFESI